MEKIETRIEKVRKRLDALIEKTNSCSDTRVIKLSRKLDKIICSYFQNKR
jgi:hypothetical protein